MQNIQNVEWVQLSIETLQLMSGFRTFKEFATILPVANYPAEKIIFSKTFLMLLITKNCNKTFFICIKLNIRQYKKIFLNQ